MLQIKDDFAVGPLIGIETEEGWNSRVNWWRELLKNSPYENDPQTFFDDRETVKKIKEQLDTNAPGCKLGYGWGKTNMTYVAIIGSFSILKNTREESR